MATDLVHESQERILLIRDSAQSVVPRDSGPQRARALRFHQPGFDRIRDVKENDGNRSRSILSGQCFDCRSRHKHINVDTDQIISQAGKSVKVIIGVATLDW